MNEMMRIYQETSRNGMLFAAFRMISSEMFSGGIHIELEEFGKKHETTDWFNDIVSRYWMKFVREAVIQAYMFGFFVVTFARPDSSVKDDVPIIPPLGSYSVSMYYDHNVRKYHVYEIQQNGMLFSQNRKLLPRALVFEIWAPGPSGRINSPVAAVIGEIIRLREMWENVQAADFWRSNPPSVRQRSTERHGGVDDPLPEMTCAEDDIDLDSERHHVRQTREDYNLAAMSSNLARQQNRGQVRERYNERTSRFEFVERASPWESNKMILPSSQVLARHTVPEFHPDYVRVVQLQQQTIAIALGIPAQFLFNDHRQHAADTELTAKIFNTTILDMQNQFKIFLTRIYYEIYQDVMDVHIEQDVLPKIHTHRKRILNEQEIQQIFDKIKVNITFNFTPMVRLEDITTLMENQWMDHDTAGRYALALFGFPEEDLLSQNTIRTTSKDTKKASAAENPKGTTLKPVEQDPVVPAEDKKKRQKESSDDSAAKKPRTDNKSEKDT